MRSFYKSLRNRDCPNRCQRVSKKSARNRPNSRLQFLCASFYVPEPPCSRHQDIPLTPRYTAQELEASCMQVFDLVYTLLFGVYHLLRTELLCDFHPFEGAGVDILWFSVYRVDTHSVPLRRSRDQFKHDMNKTPTHFWVSPRFQTPIRWNHYH